VWPQALQEKIFMVLSSGTRHHHQGGCGLQWFYTPPGRVLQKRRDTAGVHSGHDRWRLRQK
ncbi:MAG: hypothetical protein PVJ66_08745, partial [Gammaproteobacteria bacterium]